MLTSKFFSYVRTYLFAGKLTQDQVDGMNVLYAACEAAGMSDYRQVAYLLATTYHETAKTMQPIAEYGKGCGKAYGLPIGGLVYYGRGYCQLTWLANYKKMSPIVGLDLVKNPDLAMKPDIAAKIIVHGMMTGMFTGKRLSNYIVCGKEPDYYQARRIINGMDKATTIQSYAEIFEKALTQ